MVLPALLWLLDHPELLVRRESCSILSNITAGTAEQIQAMIDAAIFPKLIDKLKIEDIHIQKEVMRTISNTMRGGTSEQVWYLINEGVIPLLCKLLHVKNLLVVITVLEALKRMLIVGKRNGGKLQAMISILTDCEGMKAIQQLQKHNDRQTQSLSKEIVKSFFD